MELSDQIQVLVQKRLKTWQEQKMVDRLWQRDPSIWKKRPEDQSELADRLGWLNIIEAMNKNSSKLKDLAEDVRKQYENIILLGMGGSSLAPDVFYKTFGSKEGYPCLKILDSTHPQSVQSIGDTFDLNKTLFLVASKSGGTVETLSFYKYFYSRLREISDKPGKHFIALTDPGSGLEKLAGEKNFYRIMSTPEDVGGRYSALTYFGLLPAALIGVDIDLLLKEAQRMKELCSPLIPVDRNPGFILGAALGELAIDGRDKISFIISPSIASFGDWIEQLIAESTGKEGKGILPVVGEEFDLQDDKLPDLNCFGRDRYFVYLRLAGDDNKNSDRFAEKLKEDGRILITIDLENEYNLGGEFFRWEMATAMAGEILQIHPFNQPDVQLAKTFAIESLDAYKKAGYLPQSDPVYSKDNISVYGSADGTGLDGLLANFLASLDNDDYIAVMAFIPPSAETDIFLRNLVNDLRQRFGVAVTAGYGPRFLHSTGQLHKGGKNNGYFIQITCDPAEDIILPDEGYSFNVLISAQAQGDMQALLNRDRKVIRFHIHGDLTQGLKKLSQS